MKLKSKSGEESRLSNEKQSIQNDIERMGHDKKRQIDKQIAERKRELKSDFDKEQDNRKAEIKASIEKLFAKKEREKLDSETNRIKDECQ
jgi:hypothetical protein